MRALVTAALVSEVIWVGSLLFIPWRDHVFAFLGFFGAAFAVYLLGWRSLVGLSRPPSGWLVVILVAGLAFRVTVFFSPPSLSDDVYRYLWDGRVQSARINPYDQAPDDPALAWMRDENHASINHRSVPTIYPPLAQVAFRLAAVVSPTVMAQRLVFLGFDVAVVILLTRYLRRKGLPAERVLLYAWNPLVVVEFSSSGHLDSMALFFLMAGLFTAEAGQPLRAGALFGLSFLGKLAAMPLVPWMIVMAPLRRSLASFAAVVAAGYAGYLLWPSIEIQRNLFAGATTYARSWYFNAGLYAMLAETAPLSGAALKAFLLGLMVTLSFWMAARFRRDQLLAYTGILWALLVFVSPVVHPWYVVWLVPFLCFYPLWSGLALTGLTALSYVVLDVYSRTGVWDLPDWVPWIEYGVPLALLAVEASMKPTRASTAAAAVGDAAAPDRPSRTALIIPALNEEKALPLVLREVPRDIAHWVIVVDNGSSDRTAEVARAGGALVVKEERRGYGRAVLKGLASLPPACDVVVVMDGDHSDHPEDSGRLVAPILRGDADFVIGSRVLGGAEPGSLAPQQRFGNWLSCLLIRLLFGRTFTDLGPFRAIRREALERLGMEEETFGWNVEMQIKAICAGLRIEEVPVSYRPRIGVSKISGTLGGSFMAGVKILETILKHGIARPAASYGTR